MAQQLRMLFLQYAGEVRCALFTFLFVMRVVLFVHVCVFVMRGVLFVHVCVCVMFFVCIYIS